MEFSICGMTKDDQSFPLLELKILSMTQMIFILLFNDPIPFRFKNIFFADEVFLRVFAVKTWTVNFDLDSILFPFSLELNLQNRV